MKKTGIKWSILSQDFVKTTLGAALLSVIMGVVAKEERKGDKGDKIFNGGEGVCRYTCFNQRARVSLYCDTYAVLVVE